MLTHSRGAPPVAVSRDGTRLSVQTLDDVVEYGLPAQEVLRRFMPPLKSARLVAYVRKDKSLLFTGAVPTPRPGDSSPGAIAVLTLSDGQIVRTEFPGRIRRTMCTGTTDTFVLQRADESVHKLRVLEDGLDSTVIGEMPPILACAPSGDGSVMIATQEGLLTLDLSTNKVNMERSVRSRWDRAAFDCEGNLWALDWGRLTVIRPNGEVLASGESFSVAGDISHATPFDNGRLMLVESSPPTIERGDTEANTYLIDAERLAVERVFQRWRVPWQQPSSNVALLSPLESDAVFGVLRGREFLAAPPGRAHAGSVMYCSIGADRSQAITVGEAGDIALWDLDDARLRASRTISPRAVSATIHPATNRIIVVDDTCAVWAAPDALEGELDCLDGGTQERTEQVSVREARTSIWAVTGLRLTKIDLDTG